jgi:hypothetical protein
MDEFRLNFAKCLCYISVHFVFQLVCMQSVNVLFVSRASLDQEEEDDDEFIGQLNRTVVRLDACDASKKTSNKYDECSANQPVDY